ncbi:P-loop NTPase fold protein [Streptomyces violaceus]|uniref:KAP family P-loop NTPase fold protein n=1 Tax=Streptomyces violaceus TaxID=1936 RepID=UPI003825F675
MPVRRILGLHSDASRSPTSNESENSDTSQHYVLLNDDPPDKSDDDLLGADEIATGIASILTASRTASPFVLAIDGGWGVGKSTLMRLIESRLVDQPEIFCVRFNAWTAHGSSALEGLIKSVLGRLDRNVVRRSVRRLAEQRHMIGIAWFISGIIARLFGISRLIDEIWKTLTIDAKSRNEMRELISGMLSDWVEDTGRPNRALVVFVDDLDRCSDSVVIEVCEAVKLYLDAPGLIFILACDSSVLARSVSTSARGGVGEGRAYLEKIVQVAYRVSPPDEEQLKRLIAGYGQRSGTSHLVDEIVTRILLERAGSNPRRIKRIINGFILEYRLNPAWHTMPLDSSLLITAILLQHLYASFYDFMVTDESSDDPIGDFLDYATVRAKASTPPSSSHTWWTVARRTFQKHGLPAPDRSATGEELMREVERLEVALPEDFPALARNSAFISLLRSIGDKETRQALGAELVSGRLSIDAVGDG